LCSIGAFLSQLLHELNVSLAALGGVGHILDSNMGIGFEGQDKDELIKLLE
jgi:hypothetical protein